jgi:putative oxidoreductase
MSTFQNAYALAGRLLIALLFVPAGLSKIGGFEGAVGYIASKGLPAPTLGAIVAILVEVGLGLALAFGFKARAAALILAIFSVVSGIIFHNYWAMEAAQVMVNQIMFMKNLAIAGGLLGVVAWGAGAYSLDSKLSK